MKKFLVLAALAAAFTGCSLDSGVQNGSVDVNGAVAKSATQPYVKLVWATANSVVNGGSPYTKYALSVSGLIEVENVAYNKQVIVHWLSNSVWVDTPASYYKANGGNEYWIFKTGAFDYLPYFGSVSINFAIRYTVNGITMWDNNGGGNYSVYGQGAGTPVNPVALGSDNVKRELGGLYPSSTVSNWFTGSVCVKNLAYAKTVTLVCTTNNWASSFKVSAVYYYLYNNNTECWKFDKYLPVACKSLKYYIQYSVNGASYTDNNVGSNYTASF